MVIDGEPSDSGGRPGPSVTLQDDRPMGETNQLRLISNVMLKADAIELL